MELLRWKLPHRGCSRIISKSTEYPYLGFSILTATASQAHQLSCGEENRSSERPTELPLGWLPRLRSSQEDTILLRFWFKGRLLGHIRIILGRCFLSISVGARKRFLCRMTMASQGWLGTQFHECFLLCTKCYASTIRSGHQVSIPAEVSRSHISRPTDSSDTEGARDPTLLLERSPS